MWVPYTPPFGIACKPGDKTPVPSRKNKKNKKQRSMVTTQLHTKESANKVRNKVLN
jgi:hypothetical protein